MSASSALRFGVGASGRVMRSSAATPRAWPLMLLLAGVIGAALPVIGLGPQAYEQRQASRQASDALRGQRDAARARLEVGTQNLERLKAELAALPGAEAVVDPPDALLTHRLALEHAVRLERLNAGPQRGKSGSPAAVAPNEAATPWTLQVRGSYRSLLAYLSALEQTGPAWSLKRLQISAGQPNAHRLSLVLEPLPPSRWTSPQAPRMMTYRMVGDPFGLPTERLWARSEVPAVLLQSQPRTELPPADPLADLPQVWRAEFERPRGPLESLALKDFFLTGTLKQGRVWVALLRAGSAVHTVAVGDYVGPDLGRVQSVDESGLELREIRRDPSGRWVEQVRRWPVGGSP